MPAPPGGFIQPVLERELEQRVDRRVDEHLHEVAHDQGNDPHSTVVVTALEDVANFETALGG